VWLGCGLLAALVALPAYAAPTANRAAPAQPAPTLTPTQAAPAPVQAAPTSTPANSVEIDAATMTLGFLVVVSIAMLVLWLVAAARARRLDAERRIAAAGRDTAEAALEAAPAASYRWRADGSEEFSPGPIALFATGERPRFADIVARFTPDDAAEVARAVERLRADGTEFAISATAAGSPVVLDLVGRRLRARDGAHALDIVWLIDAAARAGAAAQREAMRSERNAMREILETLPVPVWRRDRAELKLVGCNRAYATAVDGTVETALAEGRELLSGALLARGRALAEQARDSGAAQTEAHHVVINGSRRFIELTELPLPRSGELLGFARDLTDLETARAELQRHIAAHGEVLEAVASAIAIYGPDTRLKFFNSAFAKLWRLEEDWLYGEPSLDEVLERLRERRRLPEHADFRAFKRQQLRMFTSLIQPQEELLHLPDERTLRLVVSTHPFGGLTFVYEDVTDRLALERSYNTLIEVQRETLDNLYEGIAVFGSDGRLKLFNPAYGKMWKLSPDDLAGEPHVSQIVEKTRAFFEAGGDWPELKNRIIARVTSWTASSGQMERRDGSMLEVATVPLPDGNVLLSYLDVTDSTRVQRALSEKNEALETSGRLKSEFIANVSYELRTPLNAIIGFAEILTNQYFGELNARQIDYSRGILDSSHRLLSLINDILDLATIEAGYMTLETERVEIHSLMASVLALTRERARKQNLNLDFDCSPDIGFIIADERRLKQALFNLISNAIKFTPPGGTIILQGRRLENEVALTVADTGVGIAREHQARVFEKFERGNPHGRSAGAGLGLSLVKSFIELHGGRVEMDSQPGQGTRVTCYLSAAGAGEDISLAEAQRAARVV
jgi:signal transduction histidine kinase